MTDQANQAVEAADPEQDLLNALGGAPEPEEPTEEAVEGDEPNDEEAEPEQDEEKPAVSQKFRVKVKSDAGEDEERDLSLEELAAGYMQSADYTRKTQALAAEAKARQEEAAKVVQQTTQQAVQQVQALQHLVLTTAAPDLQNVNWQQLAMEDPARYVQLQAKQQQLSQVLGHLQAQQAQLQQQQEAEAQRQREQALKHSLEYLSREIPGFNLEKDAKTLRDVAKRYSFSDEEISAVSDGRFIHLLHDAMKWRELQTAKPKALQKVAEAPKVIKPAAPQPRKQNQSALDRLQKTGRPSELVNFL
jgi:hypothetical protein